MVTETAVEGHADKKCAWVDQLVVGAHDLRRERLPIVGLTWWPLFDFVDWSWASGGRVVEEFYERDGPRQRPCPVVFPGVAGGPVVPFLRRMGMYQLETGAAGLLERRPTRLGMQKYLYIPSASGDVGDVNEPLVQVG
jgi:beta-glucosidase